MVITGSARPYDPSRNPAYRIDHSVDLSGKVLASTKRRVKFVFGFSNAEALESGRIGIECRGAEHTVELIWSLTSGKRTVLMDGRDVHYSVAPTGESKFRFGWTMPGNVNVTIIAHAAPMSTKVDAGAKWRQYDLLVDNVSFFDLPKVFEIGIKPTPEAKAAAGHSPSPQAQQHPQQQRQQQQTQMHRQQPSPPKVESMDLLDFSEPPTTVAAASASPPAPQVSRGLTSSPPPNDSGTFAFARAPVPAPVAGAVATPLNSPPSSPPPPSASSRAYHSPAAPSSPASPTVPSSSNVLAKRLSGAASATYSLPYAHAPSSPAGLGNPGASPSSPFHEQRQENQASGCGGGVVDGAMRNSLMNVHLSGSPRPGDALSPPPPFPATRSLVEMKPAMNATSPVSSPPREVMRSASPPAPMYQPQYQQHHQANAGGHYGGHNHYHHQQQQMQQQQHYYQQQQYHNQQQQHDYSKGPPPLPQRPTGFGVGAQQGGGYGGSGYTTQQGGGYTTQQQQQAYYPF